MTPPRWNSETLSFRDAPRPPHRTTKASWRELDVLRAERDVLVGVLKSIQSPLVQDEITLRFSRMGFPGCGLDPD